jgi:hypothetical protein
MLVSCLAVVATAVTVHVAVADHERAVTTVGQDDTAGIRAAQRVRSDLAEMDLIVTEELLRPRAERGALPGAYNAKHRQLVAHLDAASRGITLGTAETVPLANLQYERSQYQALVRDAVLADQAGDRTRALALEKQAHEVMVGLLGLQDQAGAFDKANTYALNQNYGDHTTGSGTSQRWLVAAGLALVLALLAIQVGYAVLFHRLVNLGLVTASVVALVVLGVAGARVNSSSEHLTTAREQAFDPVHELWQARAAAYAARQAEAQALLEPAPAGAGGESPFHTSSRSLYRLADAPAAAVAASARQRQAPPGSGGYLARALMGPAVSAEAAEADGLALERFGEFLDSHERLLAAPEAATGPGRDITVARYLNTGDGDHGQAFNRLVAAIDATLDLHEAAFSANAGAAADALNGVDGLNLAAAAAMVVLIVAGLGRRLREYAAS